jgi:hypothetical protein
MNMLQLTDKIASNEEVTLVFAKTGAEKQRNTWSKSMAPD